eukprot:Gb_04114 [translate_table: standard]
MQRGCRLRSAGLFLLERLTTNVSQSSASRFLHSSTAFSTSQHKPASRFLIIIQGTSLSGLVSESQWGTTWHRPQSLAKPLLTIQKHPFASKTKERTLRAPPSKLKKIKMKSYSSFKFRFRTLNSGLIRRWRAGKRHNAHSKSKKSKRRLRQPSVVPLAYAKVMKKLNFCA